WTFRVDKPGSYDGACSEYCGGPHAWMRLGLVAQPAADFQAWAQAQKAGTAPASTPGPGLRTFTENACSQCHAIRGTTATGAVAPDLTHVASREMLAGGALRNTLADMRRWLHDPQAVKPGSLMPNMHLSDDEVNALAQYLEGLK
ncbi:MAG: c-type cytochrome, partial [Chloroflexota bacterium]|nr:c-type cytochrome [Chloroflexota bacterium]